VRRIAAYLMNWRGDERMREFAELPGRKWALVEHARFGALKAAAGNDKRVTPIDPEVNNKFVLVEIE
jgi:hypothetical protein